MKKFSTFLNEDKAQKGEGHVLWHTSKADDVDHFHPLTHFGTKQASRDRGLVIKHDNQQKIRSAYAVRIKHGKSFKIDDDLEDGDHNAHSILHAIHSKGMINDKEHHETTKKLGGLYGDANTHVANLIRSKGYHSLHYKNSSEDPGSTSHIITHPSQVRIIKSRLAKKNNSLNLKKSDYTETKVDPKAPHLNIDFSKGYNHSIPHHQQKWNNNTNQWEAGHNPPWKPKKVRKSRLTTAMSAAHKGAII